MSTVNLKTVEARSRLQPSREPYYSAVRTGSYIGFRKMSAGTSGSWVARHRVDGSRKQLKVSLGAFDEVSPAKRYDAALAAAEAWFTQVSTTGATTKVKTVRDACTQYVQHIEDTKGKEKATETRKRFDRWVFNDALAHQPLSKLTRRVLEAWRIRLAKSPLKTQGTSSSSESQPRAAATVNRDIASLRAALNYARKNGDIHTDAAWLGVLQSTKNATQSRTLYLTSQERQKLVSHAVEEIQPFLKALCLLPLRPGAMSKLCVRDFDQKLGMLMISHDKAGQGRQLKLPAQASDLFKTQCASKLPGAPIFMQANGKAWNKDAWKHPIKEAFGKAKLPAEGVAYTLRHSTITDLAQNLDLLTVARISGTSIEMIQRHYGHLQQERATEALAVLAFGTS